MSEQIGRQAARQSMAQKILVGCGLFGGAVGAGGALLSEFDLALPPALVFGASLVAVAVFFWVCVVYWRNIDEAAREAHKFAWFWGGTGGLLSMLPLGALVGNERLLAVFSERSPGEWVALGFLALLTAQLIGYALVWVGWWLRQR